MNDTPNDEDEDENNDENEHEYDDEMPKLISKKSSSIESTSNLGFGSGYDYSQHMREIRGGQLYSKHGNFTSSSEDLLSKRVELPAELLASCALEHERMLDAITADTHLMERDLSDALVNADCFEEMDDEFMNQALAAPDQDDNEDDINDGFDYDAHIARLIAAADGDSFRQYQEPDSDEDDDDIDEDYEHVENVPGSIQELDSLFEKIMTEYDDDQIGDLEGEEEDELQGTVLLEGDFLNELVDDFINMKQDLMDDEGAVGNPLRAGINDLKAILMECEENQRDAEEAPVEEFNPENEPLPFQEYLAAREVERWDCETIVSTYSNVENHPTFIAAVRKARKLKLAHHPDFIQLSSKSGMPLKSNIEMKSISEEKESDEKEEIVHSIVTRSREESKEEKKVRKEYVKALKQARREIKRNVKMAFKTEEKRQKYASAQSGQVHGRITSLK